MSTTTTKRSIVKSSKTIRDFLQRRMEELGLKAADIIKDAADRDMNIDGGAFSKFMKHGDVKGCLSEENIIWLCLRWGINIHLIVGTPVIKDQKLKMVLPTFDEKKALEKLESINWTSK